MIEDPNVFLGGIWHDVVQPDQRARVTYLTAWRWRWEKIGDWTEGISQILTLVTAILAYAAGVFIITALSFSAGTVGVTAIAMFQFSKYSAKQSMLRSAELQKLLKDIKRGEAVIDDPVPPDPKPIGASKSIEEEE